MSKLTIKESIDSLPSGHRFIVPEGDYGKAEIWKIHDVYILFGVPQYGGQPWFHKVYMDREINEMINTVSSWN